MRTPGILMMVGVLLVHTLTFQSGTENFAIWGYLFGDKGSNSEVGRDSRIVTSRIRKGENSEADALGKLLLLLCVPRVGSLYHVALEKGSLAIQVAHRTVACPTPSANKVAVKEV